MKVTFLNGLYKVQAGHLDLVEIFNQIKNGVHSPPIFHCRSEKNLKGKKAYQQAKLNLPCFTPSGRFGQGFTTKDGEKRPVPPRICDLLEYNGIVVLDYDGLTGDFDLYDIEEKAKQCPYTFACFTSPSREGYKILVRTSNKNHLKHAIVFNQVKSYYDKLTGFQADKSGKNVNRLCFVSVDFKLMYNLDSSVFEFQAKIFEEKQENNSTNSPTVHNPNSNDLDDITKALNKVEKNGFSYVNGQRHEYVKQFSIECVKYGVPLNQCLNFVDANFVSADCIPKKVLAVVHWAYENIKEVGIYDTWRKNSIPEDTGKKNRSKKKEYTPELYKATDEEELIINLPELSFEEIQELEKDTRKSILYQKILEDTLDEFFDFRINILKNREEYKQKNWKEFKPMGKIEYNSIVRALKKNGIKSTPKVLESIILSQFSKQVHPLKENFEGWSKYLADDKTDYIEQVTQLIKTDAPKGLFSSIFKKWLVASVANVFVEGNCTNHHCIILCGNQGTNKTTFFSSLFSKEYLFTGHIDLRNKDSQILLTDTFIVLLDEQFSILSKEHEWETLKSLISIPRIKNRWHYDKTSKSAPRIANFCGTANRIEILQDDTGNRRFFPFQLTEPIDINKLQKIDLRKMWAQAYNLFKSGWYYLPNAKEKRLIDNYQHGFKKLANEHYLIMDLFQPHSKKDSDLELISSTEIWKELDRHYSINKDVSIAKIGRAMTFLKFEQKTVVRDVDKRRARYWHVKRINKKEK